MQFLRTIFKSKITIDIFLIIIFCYFFWLFLEILSPLYYLYDDNVGFLTQIIFNWEAFFYDQSIPFINFHQALGEKYLSGGQKGIFYPLNYLVVFLSQFFYKNNIHSYDILVLIHQIISGIGVYLVQKKLKISRTINLLCVFLWLTLPFGVIVSKSWLVVNSILAFIPWNFFILLYFLDKPNFKNAFFLGFIKTLALYGGHPQFLFILCYSELIFLFFYFLSFSLSKKNLWKFLSLYFFSLLTFFCFSLIEIFPIYDNAKNSELRSEKLNINQILYGSINFFKFFKTQLGFNFNSKLFNANYIIIFIGFPFLLTCVFLFIRIIKIYKKNFQYKYLNYKKNWIFVFSLTSIIIFLFGTDFYEYLLIIPLFDLFRWPFKHFIYFLFFFVISFSLITNNCNNKKILKIFLTFLFFSILLNITINYKLGKKELNSFFPIHINNYIQDPLHKIIKKTKGRIFNIGYPKNQKIFISIKNFPNFLFLNFATFWKYFAFSGYNALNYKNNFHLSLKKFLYLSFDLSQIKKYLPHLSRWSGRYLITYNHPEVKNEIQKYPQFQLIHQNNEGQLVYENEKALPLVYLESNPTKPVKFEIITNTIKAYPENIEKNDKLIATFIPLDGYRYKTNLNKNYKDLEPLKINIPPRLREVCFFEGKKLDPCLKVENKYDFEKISRQARPITIPIKPGTTYVEINYRDKYFFYGLYVMIGYILVVGGGFVGIKIYKKRRDAINCVSYIN